MSDPTRASSSAAARLRRGVATSVAAALVAAGVGALGASPASADEAVDLTGYVNPFIGTQDEGNTYPGATVPFGMVQMSPDTGHNTGYDYTQSKIRGFSLAHMSGVGCGLDGFVPILPTTGAISSTDNASYNLSFSHADEEAHPGYYKVALSAPAGKVTAELSATEHTGVQRYTYPATTDAKVLVDAGQALSTVTHSSVSIDATARTVTTATTVRGFCQDTEPFTVYSTTKFARAFTAFGTWTGSTVTAGATSASSTSRTGAYLQFDTTSDQVVEAQTSLSYVDGDGADANLAAEHTTLAAAKDAAHDTWQQWLGKVKVTSQDQTQLRTFYSALYRSFLAPNTGTDVDGRYMGWDGDAHQAADGFTYYQNFSLWDTYRTQEQMLALLAPEQARDMARSVVLEGEQGGWAPRWGYGPVETNIMTGDPVTPFLVSAYSQGLLGDGWAERAYAVLKQNADGVPPADSPFNGRAGNPTYIESGYVGHDAGAKGKPGDYDLQHGGSATLEYALADATLSTLARALGHDADADRYAARAQSYRAIWDTATDSFRARTPDGVFVDETDPASAPGFHEGTAVQYEWLVQQDMPGLVDLLGGKDAAAKRLDDFFAYDELLADPAGTAHDTWVNGSYDYYNQDKYNPNNEPDLHAPYAYLWAGQPWKTTDVVRAALTLFTDGPTGVTGNDDLGEMSSWAVMSSLGLFPIVPGTDVWGVSTPVFERAEISLDETWFPQSGGKLVLTADGVGDASHYIRSMKVGGTQHTTGYLTGDELTSAGTIDYTVGSTPSSWATGADAAPGTLAPSDEHPTSVAASAPGSVQVAAGTTQTVDLTVFVQASGSRDVTIRIEGDDDVTTKDVTWHAASDGLPVQRSFEVPVAVDARTTPGVHRVHLTVDAGDGLERSSDLAVVVPERSWLQDAYTATAIGDVGSTDASFDEQGSFYLRDQLAAQGVYQGVRTQLPADHALSYQLAAAGGADNFTLTAQTTDVSGGLAGASRLRLVAAANNGDQQVSFTITYADGDKQTATVTVPDWCTGSSSVDVVVRTPLRGVPSGTQAVRCGIFSTGDVALRTDSSVRSITWPSNTKVHVFAIASDATLRAPHLQGDVTISGTPAVGATLVASTPTWDVPGTTTSYRWNVDGQRVDGATARIFTLAPAYAGHRVSVTVTGTARGYLPTSATSDDVTVTAGAIEQRDPAKVLGTFQVGRTVRVVDGTYSVPGTSTEYAWTADGVTIAGATGSSLTLTPDLVGTLVQPVLTVTAPGRAPLTVQVPVSGSVAKGVLRRDVPVSVTGAAATGSTLRAVAGRYTPSANESVQWLLDGKVVASGTTFAVPASAVGKRLAVRATAVAEGYTDLVTDVQVGTVLAGAVVATKAPAVSGTAAVGKKLTVSSGTYSVRGATITRQWLRDGMPVQGATGTSYVLTAADKGAKVAVRTTVAAPGYATLRLVTPGVTVKAGTITVSKASKVSGKAKVGHKLTVSAPKVSPSGVKVTYRWLRDGKAISGATSRTHVVTRSDKGKKLSVRVTLTKSGYTTVVKTTARTAKVV
ncbi:GH92 family glycosyl hydrolase [Cellulomonas sp. HZM]|uniref:GH92 family glycosyl hydrolase n=1 Tax=Cellulomonas sp. HZM TaxID=1454010 RepID=UPI0012DE6A5F|nr:GH92 family glycosyl hydrolase [Cellulomonas sp. HZM]